MKFEFKKYFSDRCIIVNFFLVGGLASNVVESYDANSNKWNRLAPMNMVRDLCTVIPLPHYMSDYTFDW